METALRRIADMLEAFFDAVAAWFATGAWRPETWPGVTWVLVAAFVVLSWLLAWRRRAPRTLDVRPPQLLVTSGEVVPDGIDEPEFRSSGRRRRRPAPEAHAAAGTYAMTVSNLSRYPVQLLEIALRDGRRGAPRVVTVDAVVPAMGSVSVSGRISLGLRGDGWLDLYCYAAAPRVKMHRHRVELVWEPWAARFKAAPLEQVSVPTRRLASDEADARFLEDDVPDTTEPAVVAVAIPARSAGRHDAAPPSATRPEPIDDRGAWAPASAASALPVPEPPAPAVPALEPAAPAVPPAPRSNGAHPTPRSTARPASPGAEPRGGVPRIATPPVGVAVTGRGGASARTAEGLPIGRPTARLERVPIAAGEPVGEIASATAAAPAPDRAPDVVRRTPVPTPPAAAATPALPASSASPASSAPRTAPPERTAQPNRAGSTSPTNAAGEAETRSKPSVRRRPRLEFPDEF